MRNKEVTTMSFLLAKHETSLRWQGYAISCIKAKVTMCHQHVYSYLFKFEVDLINLLGELHEG